MNLNKFAREVTLKEGTKKQVSIAQVKEILKIAFTELAKLSIDEVKAMLQRYKR